MATYDRAAFILAYIQASERHYIHEDFRVYYTGLFDALQQAFAITLSYEGVCTKEARHLWMLFAATADSYRGIRQPRSNFLDDSVINRAFRLLGERGDRITEAETNIRQIVAMNKEAHLQMLDALFLLLWGLVDKVVTSEDLKQLGFDDTKEPKSWHYIDDL